MTPRITRSEVAWGAAIVAVSGALYALTGQPSMWNLATGCIIVRKTPPGPF